MRRVSFALATAVLLATGIAGAGTPARAPVLAVSGSGQASALVRVEPVALDRVGSWRVPLGGYTQLHRRSPSGKLIAFGGYGPAIVRVIDLAAGKILRDVPLAGATGPRLDDLVWLDDGRAAALLRGSAAMTLALVDVARGRVVQRLDLGAEAWIARWRGRAVVVTAPERTIGPATLLVVDAAGGSRSVRLARIQAGHTTAATARPGLAVHDASGRAFVVAGGGPVAAVRLSDLRVTYTTIRAISLADRNETPGRVRFARVIDRGVLLVAGWNAVRKQGRVVLTPAGLKAIDTTTWRSRVLDEEGEWWDAWGDTAAVARSRNRVVLVGTDGRERASVPVPAMLGGLTYARGLLYVPEEDGVVTVVDPATGEVLGRPKGPVPLP